MAPSEKGRGLRVSGRKEEAGGRRGLALAGAAGGSRESVREPAAE